MNIFKKILTKLGTFIATQWFYILGIVLIAFYLLVMEIKCTAADEAKHRQAIREKQTEILSGILIELKKLNK